MAKARKSTGSTASFKIHGKSNHILLSNLSTMALLSIHSGTYNTHPTLPNVSLINGNGIILGVAGLVARFAIVAGVVTIASMIFVFFIKLMHLSIDFLKSFVDDGLLLL
jgi:hypothetical protein